jgi:asparagine synthetase B (glutamine-hydrolysing)
MSDFIFSSTPGQSNNYSRLIEEIYVETPPPVNSFEGAWGSLATSKNLYNGFQPLDTDSVLVIVTGGPILCFQSNAFLTGDDPVAGTRAIYERWRQGNMRWDEDLSGPFVILIIDKSTKQCTAVTDLLACIPLYRFDRDGSLFLGTHIDALAQAAGLHGQFDLVSLANFVIYDHVTFPYTVYTGVRQCLPATIHQFGSGGVASREETYWLPRERTQFRDINEAALVLREGVQDFVQRTTESMSEVAHFLSAGEDSRAVAGLLPDRLKRHAFTFLDTLNREGRLARKVAESHGSEPHIIFRSPNYYLEILPAAATLIGNGYQYEHAHSMGLYKQCNLNDYPAVFGGYISDSLLKGTMRQKIWIYSSFRFLPDLFVKGETRTAPTRDEKFTKEILSAIDERRRQHLELVKSLRPQSCHEWFHLWPLSMRATFPNFYSNRRLFRTYEPFMAKQAIKVSAGVPIYWKLNRRLFNRAFHPAMQASKWRRHPDGRFPYFSWWINLPIQISTYIVRKCLKLVGINAGYQGPWGDWRYVLRSPEYAEMKRQMREHFHLVEGAYVEGAMERVFIRRFSTRPQMINLLSTLYLCGKHSRPSTPASKASTVTAAQH